MKIIIKQQFGKHTTKELWIKYFSLLKFADQVILDIPNVSLNLDNTINIFKYFDQNFLYQNDSLTNHYKEKKFDIELVEIPLCFYHIVHAVISIFPLDQYLAAHYERQLLEIIQNLSKDQIDWLNANLLKGNTGIEDNVDENIVKFIKLQRKLYLHYERED